MKKNYFNKNYVDYWKKRVKNDYNGHKTVPEKNVQKFFINKLNISEKDLVLDLGCGHGALFELLHSFSKNIIGMDINKYAIKEALNYPYRQLKRGSAEKTTLPKEAFDKVIAWAVYDVVDQNKALVEENRILKDSGVLLITGKNRRYLSTDREAFIAERNAKLKNFPNHFTDVYGLIKNIAAFGFEVVEAYGFIRRGDFANKKYIDLLDVKNRSFYEFLLILKKIDNPESEIDNICMEYSDTASKIAEKYGFSNIKKFFKWHKEKYES